MNQKIVKIVSIGLLAVGAMLMMVSKANAQEYKIAKSTGKLEVKEVNRVTFEGYNGNEIVFTSLNHSKERDQRAEGLRAISSMGLEDNTGIGLSVMEKGNVIEVQQLKKMGGPDVKIMVPKGVIVSYSHSSPHGGSISFKNMESELEVSTQHNNVSLSNVTGPMTVKTIHGKIEVDFNTGMKSPISIVSLHGLVDVTIPVATKANVSMSAGFGEIFVDPAIKIDFDKKDDEWIRFGSGKVNGKINGGGLDMSLSTSHGNIYLRKK